MAKQRAAEAALVRWVLSILKQNALNATVIGPVDIIRHPVFAEQVFREFDNDVIGIRSRIVTEAMQPLQTRRTRGQDFDLAREAIGA